MDRKLALEIIVDGSTLWAPFLSIVPSRSLAINLTITLTPDIPLQPEFKGDLQHLLER